MRFIHCADIHLDSPFLGLSARPDAPRDALFGATRQAFTALVDRALREAVDFVVIAGDLYDGTWKDYTTGLFFVKEMGRLARAGIPVYLLHGNHDAESQLTRKLVLPDNVQVFSHRRPQTFTVEGHRVALHGQSFANRAVTENLAALYPEAVAGAFNIGVLHTAADGRDGHDTYAPCRTADLLSRDYQYWALGHVHTREVLHEYPHVVFPGNLQGRHARETGPKGFSLITVSDNNVTRLDHVPVDVVRWTQVAVDASGAADFEAVARRLASAIGDAIDGAEGRLLALRIVLTGRTAAHHRLKAEAERLLYECQAAALVLSDSVWIEKLQIDTRPVEDEEVRTARADAVGVLMNAIETLTEDEEAMGALRSELSDLLARLPADARRPFQRERNDLDPALLAAILDDARALIGQRVLEGDAGA